MGETKLSGLLSSYEAFITYVPLRTEVDWRPLVSLQSTDTIYGISPRAALDPVKEATAACRVIGPKSAVIFIPGRKFDASGTRHGQGGGWYDRFLAQVPREWLRIGFCYDQQFSETPLPRESWDQAMDGVCVVNPDTKGMRLFGML